MTDNRTTGRIDTYDALARDLKAKGYYLTTDSKGYDLYVQRGSCKGAKISWQGDDDVNDFRAMLFTRDEVMDMTPRLINIDADAQPNKREFI